MAAETWRQRDNLPTVPTICPCYINPTLTYPTMLMFPHVPTASATPLHMYDHQIIMYQIN